MKPKVFFTDFRTKAHGAGLPKKLQKLIRKAGIGEIDMDGKFVAIKIHFGELGNISYLRPNYARAVVDAVKELGGKPFLTDCNTMYPGSRKNAIEHLYCAWENGFTPMTVGCPIIIGDGLKGTDDVEVPVEGGEYVKAAKIGRAVMDADIFISLSHFKGHEMTGFGGAISMMVGILPDGSVKGISIVSHAETPGLGAKSTEAAWRAQFAGQTSGLALDKKGGEIAPLTGATITSQAIVDACQIAIDTAANLG